MLTPPPGAQIGSLEIFWPLLEPILTALAPRRICEIGVDAGALSARLLAWAAGRGCAYIGIDPAPGAEIRARLAAAGGAERGELLRETSLAVLPGLEPCDVYFIDGDHNYFTVANELQLIAAARNPQARAPLIFLHDAGWPWGRRDMYYLPTSVPAEARQPWSETLGVPLDGEELIEGGLREPARYAIALHPGGPRNGVLTAVEDFLRGETGAGWECSVVPIAYGLAVLHCPADPALPPACRENLADLRKMAATGGTFLQACEQNFLRLYLYGEYHRITGSAAHHATLQAYDTLLAHDREMQRAYNDLLAHSDALLGEYEKLRAAHEQLRERAAASELPPQTTLPDA